MTDDRDRRAAAEFRALNLTPLFVEAEVGADFVVDFDRQLAAFRAAARAEGAAEAIEAAARIADTEADNAATAARHVGGDDCWVKQQLCAEQAATAILHRIRALAPAGLVAVSVDVDALVADLFTNGLGEEAERLVLVDARNRDLGGWCRTAVTDRIRAAVARKEG